MKQPKRNGGKNILDIVARNEAITVTWLQSYLNIGKDRALWAYFADAIIAKHAVEDNAGREEYTRMNIFLQNFSTNTKKIPSDLRRMLKVGKDHGVRREGLAFKRETLRDMPIWLHRGINTRESSTHINQRESKCMRDNHGIATVRGVEELASYLNAEDHKSHKNCNCEKCRQMRFRHGCPNPHKCYKRAKTILEKLPPKWNPAHWQPADQEEEPGDEEHERDAVRVFNANLTDPGGVQDTFRIFTSGDVCNTLPRAKVTEWERSDNGIEVPERETVYTDGGCLNNGDENAKASAGIWFGPGDGRNKAIRLPEHIPQTNQAGETLAPAEATLLTD
ncbi:hypothetical protein BDZ89DRAFT_1243555, partial [Hymenopellis radicata]